MADVTFVGDDDRTSPQKYKDMSDGSFARVTYGVTDPGGASRVVVGMDSRELPQKLRDMGDGSFALVRIGG